MFALLLLFPFSSLEQFYSFPLPVCVFQDLFKGFVHLIFKNLLDLHKIGFMAFSCASVILKYPRLAVEG